MMNTYEQRAKQDLELWKTKIAAKPSKFMRLSKNAQTVMNRKIPDKIHQLISASIKAMVEAVLSGSAYIQKNSEPNRTPISLEEVESKAKNRLEIYRKTAVVEGAGTGAGGIFLGMTDFPLLLSIKMKYLFSVTQLYGYDPNKLEERIFILLVFQLAFSSAEKKKELLETIVNWESEQEKFTQIDWQSFQQEYRDSIDFVKMMQLVPGIGAIVGAWANYNLMDQLGETAQNCYRLRWFYRKEDE